jgi:membrane-bound lytic murein transglycosylase D
LFFVTVYNSFAQSTPKVPEKIRIDNMVLHISENISSTIQSEVDALHLNKKYFEIFLDRINIYLPIIERILEEEEMPNDLKFLALQESSLKSEAVSSSNAVGFWQFKKETGEEYGLVINDKIDERKNIVSSTRAASRYIKNSNFLFENWIFSVLSYLEGLSGAKAIVDPKLYGAKRMNIDENTHWYIIKFIAHKIAFEGFINASEYNNNYSVFENNSFNSIKKLSDNLSINSDDIYKWNTWIKSDKIPSDRVYAFIIPEKKENVFTKVTSSIGEKVNSFIKSKLSSPVDEKVLKVLSKKIIYLNGLPAVVADSVDNIDNVVSLYKISKKDFLVYNDIKNDHNMVFGVPYYLSKKRKRGRVQLYLRREEESLWEVSQLFGVQLNSIKKFNKENKSSKVLLKRRSIL